jgi:hypothetical protein
MRINESDAVVRQAADLALMHTPKELKRIERAAKLARKLKKVWSNK